MYVLLEFWQKIMAIPIMNPLSWFMIGEVLRTLRKMSPMYIGEILHTYIICSLMDWKLHEPMGLKNYMDLEAGYSYFA